MRTQRETLRAQITDPRTGYDVLKKMRLVCSDPSGEMGRGDPEALCVHDLCERDAKHAGASSVVLLKELHE
jgi:hypothetical protein